MFLQPSERDNIMFSQARIEGRKRRLLSIDTLLTQLASEEIGFEDILSMKTEPVRMSLCVCV